MTEKKESTIILRLFLGLAVVTIAATALAVHTGISDTPEQIEPAAAEEEQAEETGTEAADDTAELVLLTGAQTIEALPQDDDPQQTIEAETQEPEAEETAEETEPEAEKAEQKAAKTEQEAEETSGTEEVRTYNGISEGDTYTGTVSYYCVCLKCCGKTDGVTASGLTIYNGMEDPHVCSCNWLPLGTVVSIGGTEYTVADRGGSGLNTIGRIDIFVPEGHQKALELGRTEGVEIIVISFPEE